MGLKFHTYREVNEHREANEYHYYVAAFSVWGKKGYTARDLRTEMQQWCKSTFGPSGSVYEMARWSNDIMFGEVRFKDEADLLMFLLRWS
jgi:hypothetical protein